MQSKKSLVWRAATMLSVWMLVVIFGGSIAEAHSFDHQVIKDKNKVWTVRFNEEVDVNTITNENLYITDATGKKIDTEATPKSAKEASILPVSPYQPGMQYTIHVERVRSQKGSSLKQHKYTKTFELSQEPVFYFQGGYITGYGEHSPKDVVIPKEIDGEPVIGIASGVFSNRGIISLELPEGLQYIEDRAFLGNQLTTLEIPKTVESIGVDAFRWNKLQTLVVPGNVRLIKDNAFYGNKLKTLTLEEGIHKIDSWTFSNNQLKHVAIPNSIQSLGNNVFTSNYIRTVELPGTLKEIPDALFSHNQLSEVSIPSRVQRIGRYAFYNNKLNYLYIPDSVQKIDRYAFRNNELLLSVNVPRTCNYEVSYRSYDDYSSFDSHTMVSRRMR